MSTDAIKPKPVWCDDQQWSLLQAGPLLGVALLAGADGSFDPRERKAFAEFVGGHVAGFGSLTPLVFAAAARSGPEASHGWGAPEKGLQALADLLDERVAAGALSREDADAYKTSLLGLMAVVAQSSQGRLGFLGRKVHQKMAAIEQATMWLRL